jgi:hypothetical protein
MEYLRLAQVRVEKKEISVKVDDLPLFAGFHEEVNHADAETTVISPKEIR